METLKIINVSDNIKNIQEYIQEEWLNRGWSLVCISYGDYKEIVDMEGRGLGGGVWGYDSIVTLLRKET